MPTLEEAIGIFEQLSKLCETNGIHDSQELYKQYAAWLRELQERRKEPEVVMCGECAFCRPFLSSKVCSLGLLHNINSDMDFCSRAVRRTE